MIKAFEIAGYPASEVEARFGALHDAFRYGCPPHGGIALESTASSCCSQVIEHPRSHALPDEPAGQDLMMGAPGEVSDGS